MNPQHNQNARVLIAPFDENKINFPDLKAKVKILSGKSMGMIWRVSLVESQQNQLNDLDIQSNIETQLHQIEMQMSHWQENSILSQYNRSNACSWTHLPDAFFEVMQTALKIARQSQGAFDPTLGALVNLWGFGAQNQINAEVNNQVNQQNNQQKSFRFPNQTDLDAAKIGWNQLLLQAHKGLWQPNSIQLDLSGIAKGYAVDCVSRLLEKMGFANHLVDFGGELRGCGVQSLANPWWVGLEFNDSAFRASPIHVALCDQSLATSGDSLRYFWHENKRYSHTIDPRNRYPVQNKLRSVSVLHESCMIADAWASALTVLGLEKGLEIANEYQLCARFVLQNHSNLDSMSEHFSLRWQKWMD